MIYKNIFGKQIFEFDQLESTNLKAAEMLSDELLEEGSVLVSKFQKTGKGLDTNSWESEVGKNILVSFYISPKFIKPESQFLLNKVVSLAVAGMVKEFLPKKEVKVKWPNDVYVGDKKVCGILINNSINGFEMTSSIIGIGINVNQQKFMSDAPNPISIRSFKKKDVDLNTVFFRLCDYLNLKYRELMRNEEKLDKEYLDNLYRFEKYFIYRIANKEIEARITGIDEYGKLCLETKDAKIFFCDLKEVEFVI